MTDQTQSLDPQLDTFLRKQPVPKEVTAKSIVVDKSNLAPFEIPVERRMCPTLESVAGK